MAKAVPRCLVCQHPHRKEIEEEMLDSNSSKDVLRRLAKTHNLTQKSILQHQHKHLGRLPEKPSERIPKSRAQQLEDIPELNEQLALAEEQFDRVNEPLENLKNKAAEIRETAMGKNLLNTALLAIDKEAKLIEVQVKIAAEMRQQEIHSEIMQKREWARTQSFIWNFMDKHGLTDEFWEGLNALHG